MGEWHWPQHYTQAAKDYHRYERAMMVKHLVDVALPAIRQDATAFGYSLALHGSLVRDLDLVAIPWRDDACDAEKLIQVVTEAVKRQTGWGHPSKERTLKPHGRIAVTIIATAEVHIDLSIMPRVTHPTGGPNAQ